MTGKHGLSASWKSGLLLALNKHYKTAALVAINTLNNVIKIATRKKTLEYDSIFC